MRVRDRLGLAVQLAWLLRRWRAAGTTAPDPAPEDAALLERYRPQAALGMGMMPSLIQALGEEGHAGI
jgi:hypothetical protein